MSVLKVYDHHLSVLVSIPQVDPNAMTLGMKFAVDFRGVPNGCSDYQPEMGALSSKPFAELP